MENNSEEEAHLYIHGRKNDIIKIQNEETPRFLDYIKLNAITHPIIYVKNAEKFKYLYNGPLAEITGAKIVEFLKQVEAGKIKKYKLE